MTTFTTNIEIPYLDQNVAQPEIPENEAKDIIDAGITGQLLIDMADADLTLLDTNANGTLAYPFEWQHAILIINTANTVERTLTIPTGKSMTYIVHNKTGGFNVIITQGGTETVTVPSTNIWQIYCDGTDVWRVL